MIRVEYYCPACQARETGEAHEEGVRLCGNEDCSRFGAALYERHYCTKCETYFLPGLTHEHGANLMPRFKRPAASKPVESRIKELLSPTTDGGEIHG